MRLLNVRSYQVKEIPAKSAPPYAILSHTWDKEEVTLQDLESSRAKTLLGFARLRVVANRPIGMASTTL